MDSPVADTSILLVVFDLVGIFVFAISGGLVAVRKELDLFGVLVLAGATGLGGGFIRDVLIEAAPPAALADWRYLIVPVAAGLVAFWSTLRWAGWNATSTSSTQQDSRCSA